MFAKREGKFYPNHTSQKEETTEELPAGIYEFGVEGGLFFQRPVFYTDEFREGLVDLKGEPFDSIKKKLNGFFSDQTREIYKDTQTRHFIGFMLYGPPGTGKTCFLDLVCTHFTKAKDAVVLRFTGHENLDNLHEVIALARNKSDRMVVILLEELDKIMGSGSIRNWVERQLIEFCDGSKTPSNVLLIASTNHIDKIPNSLKARPSRFSIVRELDCIPQEVAKQIVEKFTPEKYRGKINTSELSYKVTEQQVTIDQVKYIVLNMLCNDMNADEAIEEVINNPGLKVHLEEGEDEEEE